MGWLNYMQKNRFGVYEYKRRIPKDLLGSYPQCRSGFIKFSLKTKDKNEAAIRNKQHDAQYELEFANERRKNLVPLETRKGFIKKLRRLGIDAGEDIDLLKLSAMLEEVREAQKNNKPLPIEQRSETIGVLSALSDSPEKVAAKNRDLGYGELIETLEQMIKAFNGEAADFHSIKQRYGVMRTTRLLHRKIELAGGTVPKSDTITASNTPSLSAMIDLWLKERSRPAPAQTIQEWKTASRRFEQLHGVLPVSLITKQHMRDFRDALRIVPARSKPDANFKALVAQYSKENGDYSKLSQATINKNLTAIKSLLETAIKYEFIENNPAAKILLDENPNNEDKRLVFDADDLKAIFHSPLYLGCESVSNRTVKGHTIIKDAYYWLPLLALYTGARQGELAQLKVSDIVHKDKEYAYISINGEGGKRLKTKTSKRIVPIHRLLSACGFVAYAEQCKARKQEWLFPELLKDEKINAKAFSKWFARLMDNLGITDERKDFHSFRHTFKRYAREVMTEEMSDALTGHSNSNIGRTYGGGFNLEKLGAGLQEYAPPIDLKPVYKAVAKQQEKAHAYA